MFVGKGRLILLAWTTNTQNNDNTQTHRVTYVRKHKRHCCPMVHLSGLCRVCVCLCVCMSVNKQDDGQGCVPKLLLSDLCTATEPDKCLCVFLSLSVVFFFR